MRNIEYMYVRKCAYQGRRGINFIFQSICFQQHVGTHEVHVKFAAMTGPLNRALQTVWVFRFFYPGRGGSGGPPEAPEGPPWAFPGPPGLP